MVDILAYSRHRVSIELVIDCRIWHCLSVDGVLAGDFLRKKPIDCPFYKLVLLV